MKEIKAYVRAHMADRVVEALEQAGYEDFSIGDIRGIARGLSREEYAYSVELADRYERVVKFEIVCRDEHVEHLAALIRRAACTGRKGDGMIFISPVEEAIRIRTGERGEETLLK